jgi:hypothetical protein
METRNLNFLRASGLFDEFWYLSNNPDVAQAKVDPLRHYLQYGGFEGRDPSPDFSSSKYLEDYVHVEKSGQNPLLHFVKHGKSKGYKIRPSQRNNIKLLQAKLDLINYAFSTFEINSFADLGGVWGVEAGYTFYTLDTFDLASAVLVDTHPTERVKERINKYPQLRFVHGNFGNESVVKSVGPVDAVFLFDVLLHQVDPNWDRVIEMYAHQSNCLIIFNQQWIGSKSTVRLLELGEEEYFNNVPHTHNKFPYNDLFQKLDQKHPDHNRPWRNVHHIWQWGITDTDLNSKVESLGFRLQFYRNYGQTWHPKNFEDHAFVYTSAEPMQIL